MRPWITLVTALAFAASLTATAQSSTDPEIGTWVLNLEKSKYDPPTAAPKSETRTYEAATDGTHMTVQIVTADGQSQTQTSTLKQDGKSYALHGNPNVDTIKATLVNSQEIRSTQLRGGKVVGHLTIVVSKDGKVMTWTSTLTTPSGQTQNNVRVYDRQ